MSHQPPIPSGNTSPYPLHPAPHVHHAEPAAPTPATRGKGAGDLLDALGTPNLMGLGIAAGLGTAAIVGALLFRRRKAAAAPAQARSDSGAKRGSGKSRSSANGGSSKEKRGGGSDRQRIAAGQQYEVTYFARKHKLTADAARKIIAEAGQSRAAANKLAESRKS